MLFSGSFITRASGAVGTVVASHNRGGQYLRDRVIPTDPATALQLAARTALGVASARYSNTITPLQRESWLLYAANSPTVNALGASIVLTGQQQYVRTNAIRSLLGLALIDAAPIVFSYAQAPIILSVVAMVGADPPPGLVAVTFQSAPTGGRYAIFMGEPQSPSVNWFRGPWRFMGIATVAAPAAFSMPFGSTIGDVFWIYARLLLDDGRMSGRTQDGPSLIGP